jgi:hypothetical protein
MVVTYGNLTIAVDLAPGRAGMWWFSFQIPNYAGKGKAETFRGKMGYPDRETARKHAVETVHAELSRHYAAIGQDPPGRARAADG